MRYFLALLLITLPALCFAAEIPTLTGRVVDNANILSRQVEAQLTANLEDLEKQTTNQVVVVTIPSLDGQSIEDFGVKLGRAWGIGQKGKNNGVIFIVAPNDRSTRIEVGYGLEGTLTDALSSKIIQSIVLPEFRNRRMQDGVVNGTIGIISVLGGKVTNLTIKQHGQDEVPTWAVVLLFLAFILFRMFFGAAYIATGGSGRGSGGGGFGGGGGFSGGGGSFGGGGSSGRW